MSYQEYRPSRFKLLPDVIKNLVIINALFFFATYVTEKQFGIDLTEKLGLHYFRSEQFQPYQVITYMFMHGSFSHILYNMFALWMFGSALENYWGPRRFLTYYLITGIGAAFIHYLIFYFQVLPALHFIDNYLANPDINSFNGFFNSEYFHLGSEQMRAHYNEMVSVFNEKELLHDRDGMLRLSVEYMTQYRQDFLSASTIVGASGSVFGLLLAFGMLFPNSLIYIYFAIPIRAKYFVILYGVLEFVSGIANASGDNVAHFAHLGGMLFGFILIKYWQKNDRTRFY